MKLQLVERHRHHRHPPAREEMKPELVERRTLNSAALSDPGLQRDNNEDRVHTDDERGVFVVIDGVGGEAAGDIAADIALKEILQRLQRQTGDSARRIREAITLANNAIYGEARTRPE